MPIVKEPVDQRPFDRSMISAELERFFRFLIAHHPDQPVHLDDAADFLDDDISDEQLSEICSSPMGQPVDHAVLVLAYSCELRKQITEEIMEISLALPEMAEGWLTGLLEGDVCLYIPPEAIAA